MLVTIDKHLQKKNLICNKNKDKLSIKQRQKKSDNHENRHDKKTIKNFIKLPGRSFMTELKNKRIQRPTEKVNYRKSFAFKGFKKKTIIEIY